MENRPYEQNPAPQQQPAYPQQQPAYPPQQNPQAQPGYQPPQTQPGFQPPRFSAPPYAASPYESKPRREINITEILSIVLGALSIISVFFMWPVRILGLVFGIVGTVLAVVSKRDGKYGAGGVWGLIISLFSSGMLMLVLMQQIVKNIYHVW